MSSRNSYNSSSSDTTDRFGAMGLSPSGTEPLMSNYNATSTTTISEEELNCSSIQLQALPSFNSVAASADSQPLTVNNIGCAHFRVTIHSAKSLLAVKGVTSNVFCECTLLAFDEETAAVAVASSGSSVNRGSLTDQEWLKIQKIKSYKTEVIHSTLNPIWNCFLDMGVIDLRQIYGVQFTLKHVGKLKLKKTIIGQVILKMDQILNKSQKKDGEWYPVKVSPELASTLHEPNMKHGSLKIIIDVNPITPPGKQGRKMFADLLPVESMEEKKHCARNELKLLKSCSQEKPKPGETWFIISATWVTEWLMFISQNYTKKAFGGFAPGPISNMILMTDQLSSSGSLQLRSDLVMKDDFRVINSESWKLYHSLYTGGPIIKLHIPKNCEDVKEWMKSMKLNDHATIG